MTRRTRATLYALATVLLWSTVASAFKLSLRRLDPLQLLLYASAVSTLVLAVILAAQGRLGVLLTYTRGQYLRSAVLGLLNPLLYYLVLFGAYDRLPAQEAQALNYTWAITLALLSVPLLGQRLRRGDVAGGLLGYAGVVVIATRGDPLGLHFSDPLGVSLALGSTVLWSLYWIANTRDDRDPVAALFLNFLFGLPFVWLGCALFSEVRLPDAGGLLGAAYVGTFEMGIAFVLWLRALRLAENASRVGNLVFLSPFLSLVFIRTFVGEAILPSTFAGLALIVGGLAVQQLFTSPPSAPRSSPPCA
ncbi:MAG: DMT family transporter [Deferrisomatales bacterium]|nr:DMT family transporter [Deferrisomatales bacterium]